MSNRINELKTLASLWCDENVPDQYSEETNGYGAAWEDKFAELLVHECARLVKDDDNAFEILKHFGVKESEWFDEDPPC